MQKESTDNSQQDTAIDEELIVATAKKTGCVVTAEEHNVIGGLGEAVAAVLSEKCPTPVTRIGVNDEFGHSGPAVALLKKYMQGVYD